MGGSATGGDRRADVGEGGEDSSADPPGGVGPGRKRLPSISDVSSRSSRSLRVRGRRRRRRLRNAETYLSAENLARLDETNAEEDPSEGGEYSDDGSGFSDSDSFHSAMSLGGATGLGGYIAGGHSESSRGDR